MLRVGLSQDAQPPTRGPTRLGRALAPRRQLAFLFAYSLVNWSAGNGLLPLLPRFIYQLGAAEWQVGWYLGASYAMIALGTAVAGWLADRFGHHRAMMVFTGLGIPPLLAVMSRADSFWQAAVLTGAIWWLAGMALTFASILAGLGAAPGERGRVLGFLAVAAPTGSIIGGLGIGILADRLGFSTMWLALAALYLLCPAAALFVKDSPSTTKPTMPRVRRLRVRWNPAFLVLLGVGLLAAFGSFIGSLGRSLAMQGAFSNSEITSTVAVSGLVTLPFPFLVGFLSDRLGRLQVLALCYGIGTVGLVFYALAASLWQFWAASALVAFVSYVSTGVGSALVVDLVERSSVGRGLALFSAVGWAGGIVGFVAGGYLFPGLGFAPTFLVGAGLLAIALLLLPPIGWSMRSARRRRNGMEATRVIARKE